MTSILRPAAGAGAIALSLLTACATPTPRNADSSAARPAPAGDTTHVARLERDARALVRASGCNAASSCRTAPVGWRGCGGPRDYLVYCPASTDTAALLRKLDELKQAEMVDNDRSGAISTCEIRLPPNVTVQGGSCAATTASSANP